MTSSSSSASAVVHSGILLFNGSPALIVNLNRKLLSSRKVYLARKRTTQDLYAIKILKKQDMIRKNMISHVLAERQVLALSRNPFVVKLYFAFEGREYLFLVMEYLIGGEVALFSVP